MVTIERVKNELEDCDFNEADVEKYFEIFPHDLNALKGRSQDKRVHHESMLHTLDDDQVLLSGDIMHTAGNMFMVINMLSKQIVDHHFLYSFHHKLQIMQFVPTSTGQDTIFAKIQRYSFFTLTFLAST